ncbi:MAG TPA: hypothetical protein VFC99_15640 [Acidimicrobiia bacterium]|nr:hypothetical protein [Acidimicrobiia bacterium]
MQTEPDIPTEPGAPAVDPTSGAGADRDRVTLETLEAELAVLEDELARVDAGQPDRPDATGEAR